MAINWDEIRKKAQAKGLQAESQVNFTRATPSLPRANSEPKPTVTPINPSTFRNAPALAKITPEQQAKNQALAVEELSGNQGNIASFARGAALATLDPFGLRKLTPQGSNVAQEQASAKNMYNIPVIKNPRAVSQGLKPVETGNIKGTYEGLGEFAGSMVGVDPVGIGLTKGIQKGMQIANKQAAKIPVLVNGKTVFVDAATQGVSKNVPAPLPRVLPKAVAAKNSPVEKPSLDEFINSQSIFHGTTADIERPLIEHANIFEPTLNRGIYTTADKSIADNYADSNGKVFTYKKPDIEKTFNYHNDKDLERVGIKIPDHYKSKTAYNEYMNKAWKSEGIDYSKNMDSAREDAIFDRLAIRALKNMGDGDAVNTWRNIKNTPLSEMAAEQDYMVEKVLNQINDDLIKDGFNFAQHKGGIRQGNKQHDVYIALKDNVLEEQDVDSLAKLYNDTYGKPQQPPRATESTVQPILPQKGAEIPTEIKTPEVKAEPIQEKETSIGKFFRLDNGVADVSGHIPKDGSLPFIDQIYYSSKLADDVTDVSNIPKQFVGKGNINKAVTNAIDYIGKNGKAEFQIKIMNGQSKKVMDRLVSEGKIKQLTDYKFEGDDVTYAINNPQTIPRATESTVQPILPQKGAEIPTAIKTPETALKNETYKKALMQTALDEYDRTIASIADYISNYKPKGVDIGVIPKNGDELMRDGGIRYAASKNDLWYQDFYKKYGRKPSKSETKELATQIVKESLRSKSGEFYNPDLGKIVEELHGLKKDLGADTFKGEKTIDDLVNEFGAMPKGESPRAREISVPKKTNYGDVQQYARTLQESAIVDDTLYKDINEAITQGSFTKPTKSNKTAVEDANYTIEQGLDEAVTKFKSVLQADKQPTSYDIALGNRVLQELQKSGRYEEALDVAVDLSEMLSETGRTLQAARIAKRLSPEGRLMIASRTAEKVSKKTGKKINLSDETVEQISKAKTEKEVIEANQKAAVEIWNQVPANWSDKINSYRYMAMLFNPKTHVRNIVGNALFLPVREFKNLIGTGLEKALIRNGERTKAVLNPLTDKPIMEFASKDFENVKSILKNEGKLDDNVRNLDAKVFDTKILEGIRSLNLKAMDTEDTWFMKFAYDSSLAQYMKANKINPENMVGSTLESGRKYAINEALKATYRDANALANIISRAKHNLSSGKFGTLGKAGGMALEGLLPFTKTPMNIIKRGVAYSPANIIRGVASLAKVKSGKVTATEAIDQLASGLSGTALLALGTYLGYNNIVNGKEGEYKDKLYNYNQMLGSQNYSLNIDGKSYTLDWAAPLSMPFFVGVEISKAIKDNNADLASVLDSMTQISDPMVNLSMLKGINDIMTNNFEGLGQTAMDVGTGYLGQFNPTLFGQVARSTDNTRRSTISTAETSLGKGLEKFGRKQVAKIPLASNKLEPYIDLWGREQKNGTVAENFLSPGYFKQENITNVDKELKSLIGNLDEDTAKTIIPNSSAYQYTIESGSIPYRMTEKESTAYQKTKGKESYNGLNKLFASIEYRKMNSEEKVKAIQDVYSGANDKAKYEYFDSKGLPVTLALNKDYQEKYKSIKAYVSDKQFYSAVQKVKGKSTNIEKAYALAGMPDKILETFGIDTQAKEGYVPIMQKVNELKQSGISINDYTQVKQSADINASGNISKEEAVDYLNNSNYSQPQRAAMLKALVPNLKDKNNPYY